MIITNKLAKYRSKQLCNLDMFKLEPHSHLQKIWTSKDGRTFLIKDMDTMHLWHTFRMLMNILSEAENFGNDYEPIDEIGAWAFSTERILIEKTAEIARNALQYIGHELYKRQMKVPNIPKKNIKRKINRADNLNHGFIDKDEIGLDWNNGEFYKT